MTEYEDFYFEVRLGLDIPKSVRDSIKDRIIDAVEDMLNDECKELFGKEPTEIFPLDPRTNYELHLLGFSGGFFPEHFKPVGMYYGYSLGDVMKKRDEMIERNEQGEFPLSTTELIFDGRNVYAPDGNIAEPSSEIRSILNSYVPDQCLGELQGFEQKALIPGLEALLSVEPITESTESVAPPKIDAIRYHNLVIIGDSKMLQRFPYNNLIIVDGSEMTQRPPSKIEGDSKPKRRFWYLNIMVIEDPELIEKFSLKTRFPIKNRNKLASIGWDVNEPTIYEVFDLKQGGYRIEL